MKNTEKRVLQEKIQNERRESRALIQKKINVQDGWLVRLVENIDHFSYEYLSLLSWLIKWKPTIIQIW